MKTQTQCNPTNAPLSASSRTAFPFFLGAMVAPLCAVAWTERLSILFGSVTAAAALVVGTFALALALSTVRLRLGRRPSGDDHFEHGSPDTSGWDALRSWGAAEIASGVWI